MNTDVDLQQLAIERGGTKRSRVRSRRMVVTRYILPAGLVLGFIALVIWAAWDVILPPQRVTVVPVHTTRESVRREGTPLFKAAGWVEPRPTSIRVAALAPGVVEQLLVVENQPVKAGEPVAELVREDAKLSHDRALADLALQQAELEEATAAHVAAQTRFEQPVHLQAALGEANATLAKVETELENLPFVARRAEATLKAARLDYDGKLAAKDVVAGVEIDKAKSELESANALVEELRHRAHSLAQEQKALTQRRDALKTQVELLADEIKARDEALAKVKAATARLEQARVVVAEAQLRLDRMTIRAPVDGRVYRLVAGQGTVLSGGMAESDSADSSTVVTLYRPDMLQVRVDVRFEDIPKVSLGQPVQIENPALSKTLAGRVLFVSSEADIQKNTLQVKVEMISPPPVLKPEMLVDVTFVAPSERDALAELSPVDRLYISRELVHQDEEGAFVWLADQAANMAPKTRVQTGAAAANGLVEIRSGLVITNRVIASGGNNLRDGKRIEVIGEEPIGDRQNEPVPNEDESYKDRLTARKSK